LEPPLGSDPRTISWRESTIPVRLDRRISQSEDAGLDVIRQRAPDGIELPNLGSGFGRLPGNGLLSAGESAGQLEFHAALG